MEYQWKSYSDYVSFVNMSLDRWAYHCTSPRYKEVLEEVKFCVRLLSQTETTVEGLARELKKNFGFQIPIVWNAPAEGYFDNYAKLCKEWNLLSERPLH